MQALLRTWIVFVGVAFTGVALAAPRVDVREQFKRAAQLEQDGEYEQALELIVQGLAAAPKDLKLLGLKGAVLIKLRDYAGALAAYRAYLDAGATGANRREAQKIVDGLSAVQSTFLEITLASGAADVYLDSKTLGRFCRAEPACNRAVLPGAYQAIVERPGFERWTGPVTVEKGRTAKLAVTLVEQPSLLTVRVEPPGARVTVDGAAHDAAAPIAAGAHQLVISLAGHVEERREIAAHEGKPIELQVALVPLVPIHVEPPGAELVLDGKPVTIEAGGVAVPRGAHVLAVRAPGFRGHEIEIPAERGPDYRIAVELARVAVDKVDPDEGRPRRGVFSTKRKLAVVLAGVGLAAAAAGVVLGLRADDVEGNSLAAEHRRDKRTLQSHIAYGAAGLATGIAFGLWIDGAPGPRGSVAARAGGVTGLALAARF